MTDTVLLNATRSEAAEFMLSEAPPPRLPSEDGDGSLYSAKAKSELTGYETEESRLAEANVTWAPASRSSPPSVNGSAPAAQLQPEVVHSAEAQQGSTVTISVAPATPPRVVHQNTVSQAPAVAGPQAAAAAVPQVAAAAMPQAAAMAVPQAAAVVVPQAAVPQAPAILVPQGAAVMVPQAVVEGSMRSPQAVSKESREADVRGAFAGLPRIKPHWTHRYMKILLVGEAGLGKTTFVRNLFAAYAQDTSFPVNDASVPQAQRIFAEKPEALCTEIVLQDTENKVYFHYLVQDTPGYGDSTDLASDRRVILDYVQDSSSAYLEQEQDPGRKAAMHAIKDTRVDVCLYFIPPHRLRQIDMTFIAELAAVVPVAPVLAKADTMTADELKDFRRQVRDALRGAGVRSPFSRDALEEAGARHGPPFAVVGSNTMDLEVGRFWPVRRYPWGSVEAMLTQHSDLPVLRRLLFETAYCELKEGTEKRFHEYRHENCSGGFPRNVKSAVNGLFRRLVTVGGVVVAVWVVAAGAGLLTDEVKRKETVRRVKDKVGDVVDSAVETVQDVGEKAQEAAAVAKSTGSAVADATKRTVSDAATKASRALETEEARARREAEERKTQGWGWFRPGKVRPNK